MKETAPKSQPEQWMESSPEQLKLMERNYTPFELGSRMGIGRNISAGDVNVDSGFNQRF
jgi:hypothetical protein